MGKSKTMGAGLASSTQNNVSVNGCSGGGDKKQGRVSTIGISTQGARRVLINANGQNKTFFDVFCMNQLGGIGAGKSPFRTANSYAKKGGIQKNAPSCRPCLLL